MLTIPTTLVHQMQAHLQACLPNEGCGLAAGSGDVVDLILLIKNVSESPFLFRMDALELLSALHEIDEKNLSLLAIFHSHPVGDCSPSPTDLAEFLYPDSAMLIFSKSGEWNMAAFKIIYGGFEQIPVKLA